jgi:selenocysteine-specific elongation factor
MILATAGHIDHGKTALVRALTGVDADRLPEEKARGLSIDLGFAYATLAGGVELGFVDVPGHERFLPNMLAGVLAIDRVLLIVAADDGPRPQTIEHLDILELIGVAEVTGIITKIDRVTPARAEAVAEEVRALLADAGFSASPIFSVSSRSGEGIAALTEHLREAALIADRVRAATPPGGRFRMAIDRAFSLTGIGLVVTGTIAAGRVAIGDRLVVSPRGETVRVRGLHAQNRPVEAAAAGERCAVNIAGSFAAGAEPGRGDWLVAPERHLPARRLDLVVCASRHAAALLRDGLPVHLHLGAGDTIGRAAVLSGKTIAPGETGFVQVELEQPTAALAGDRVVLRDHAARITLVGGRVVDPLAPRRGRRLPARLAALQALAEPDPATAVARLLQIEGVVDLAHFATIRNLSTTEFDTLMTGDFRRVGTADAPVAVTPQRLAALSEALLAALGNWHRAQPDMLGPSRAALFAKLRMSGPEAALDAALAKLADAGRVLQQGGMWRLAEHQPRLAAADERLWRRILPLLDAADLRPPRVREIAEALAADPEAIERLMRKAERLDRVVKVADNRYFLPQTLARLTEIASELADASAEGDFTAQNFKDRSGVGRNLTIKILECLDRMGATRRVGDARIMLRGAAAFE